MNIRKILLPSAFVAACAAVAALSIDDAAASVKAARTSSDLVGSTQMRRVEIDVWPKTKSIEINYGQPNKAVEVAIIAQLGLDFAEIEPQTVEFAGAIPSRTQTGSFDANQDGMNDRVYYFTTKDLKLAATDTSACLTAKLITSATLRGCTTVKVAGKTQ